MNIDLTGRTAVVTGAASGIGRAIAEQLASCGANVAVVDKDGPSARETAAALSSKGAAFEVDLTNREATQTLATTVEEELGPVSIVVNAAGWDVIEPFLKNSPGLLGPRRRAQLHGAGRDQSRLPRTDGGAWRAGPDHQHLQ